MEYTVWYHPLFKSTSFSPIQKHQRIDDFIYYRLRNLIGRLLDRRLIPEQLSYSTIRMFHESSELLFLFTWLCRPPFLSIPDKNEKTKHFKYSSIKSQLDKNATKKRKRASNNKNPVGPPTPTASTSNEQWQTTTPHGNILAGKFGAKQNGNFFRAGSLPAVLSESKPMKDADRLLGVLTEHACVDSYLEEGQLYNLLHAYHFHIISVTKCSI